MIFEKYITGTDRNEFILKSKSVAKNLNIPVDWLLAVMYVESRFSSTAKNKITGATGLIQFMPETAKGLNTSVEDLAKMTRVKQLDFVYKYYRPYASKIKKFTDLYLSTFFPIALNWPDSAILETKNLKASTIAQQNKIFDLDNNNKITVGEFRKAVLKYQPPEAQALEKSLPLFIIPLLALTFFLFTRKKTLKS